MIRSKSPREIRYMCDAGKVVAQTHEELAKAAKQGISTKELDQMRKITLYPKERFLRLRDIVVFRHQSVRPLIML